MTELGLFLRVLIELLGLVGKVYDDILDRKKAAAERNEKFEADNAVVQASIAAVISRNIQRAPGESAGAGNGWDAADGSIQRPGGSGQ